MIHRLAAAARHYLRALPPVPVLSFNQKNRDAWMAEMARGIPAGSRVLDVGAGECRYAPLFAHCEYTTQDFKEYAGSESWAVPDEWSYGRIDLVSDVTDIPLEGGRFHVVVCTEVIEHVYKPIDAIHELSRLLAPGGQLFLSAPLGSGLHQQPHHYYGGFTPHFYEKAFEESGLDLVRVTPNAGLFLHLLQEVDRATTVLQKSGRYSRANPLPWLLRASTKLLLPLWLERLDDEIFIEELTVGYHVVGRKPAASP